MYVSVHCCFSGVSESNNYTCNYSSNLLNFFIRSKHKKKYILFLKTKNCLFKDQLIWKNRVVVIKNNKGVIFLTLNFKATE